MELDTFVQKTLVSISRGIEAAQDEVHEGRLQIGYKGAGRTQMVEFDIALASSTESEAKGGIGVFLTAVGIGANARELGTAASTSRVRFTVPVIVWNPKRSA